MPVNSKMSLRVRQAAKAAEERRNNRLWDKLEDTYTVSMEGITSVQAVVVDLLEAAASDPVAYSLIKEPEKLIHDVELLTRDLAAHAGRLSEIHDIHAGKKGSIKTEGDALVVLQAQGAYTDAAEFYTTTISHTVTAVMNSLGAEEELRRHKDRLENAMAIVENAAAAPAAEMVTDIDFTTADSKSAADKA